MFSWDENSFFFLFLLMGFYGIRKNSKVKSARNFLSIYNSSFVCFLKYIFLVPEALVALHKVEGHVTYLKKYNG